MLNAVGFSPLVVKTRLSAESFVVPLADSAAPPVAEELSQPRVGPLGGFAQGQVRARVRVPTGSHMLENAVASRSRMKTSVVRFVSPGTRFVACDANAIQRPSWEMKVAELWLFDCAPPASTDTRSNVPRTRSRR